MQAQLLAVAIGTGLATATLTGISFVRHDF